MENTYTEKEARYNILIKQIEELINLKDPLITNLSNITAAIKQSFTEVSWVGFYLTKDNKLFLGPFQGKVACTQIKFGEGVCGVCAEKKETIVVPNVHDFPGHIACDSESNSEIVIPLLKNEKLFGVLDLDSYNFSAFNSTDKVWLEKICILITNKLDLTKSILV
jgi:GAF domain-containing protein